MPQRYQLSNPDGPPYLAPGNYFALRGTQIVEVADDAPAGVVEDVQKKITAGVLTPTLAPVQPNDKPRGGLKRHKVTPVAVKWRGQIARPDATTSPPPGGPFAVLGQDASPTGASLDAGAVVGPTPNTGETEQDEGVAELMSMAGTGVVDLPPVAPPEGSISAPMLESVPGQHAGAPVATTEQAGGAVSAPNSPPATLSNALAALHGQQAPQAIVTEPTTPPAGGKAGRGK